jgi:hypothetical protein
MGFATRIISRTLIPDDPLAEKLATALIASAPPLFKVTNKDFDTVIEYVAAEERGMALSRVVVTFTLRNTEAPKASSTGEVW